MQLVNLRSIHPNSLLGDSDLSNSGIDKPSFDLTQTGARGTVRLRSFAIDYSFGNGNALAWVRSDIIRACKSNIQRNGH